jgi:peroxiredoxin
MSRRTDAPRRQAGAGAALLLATLAAGCGGVEMPSSAPSAIADKAHPSLDGEAMDGRQVRDMRLRGKLLVVTFFTKDCVPCARMVPGLELLSRTEPDLAVVGVAEDASETDAKAQVESWQLSFPVIHDKTRMLQQSFSVGEVPTTFLTDEGGVVRWVGGSGHNDGDLKRALAALRERTR